MNRATRLAAFVFVVLTAACSQAPTAPAIPRAAAPEPGDAAPGFSLASAEGANISLAQFRGKSPVLFYFSMGPG